MLGGNGFPNAEADENQTADEEEDDGHLLFLETLETEERDLGVEQVTAE